MEYREVLKTSQITEGQMKVVNLNGRTITLAQVEGNYYAFDDVCSHAECSLATGFLEDKAVECPCHGSKFDVETGAVLNLPAVSPIKTYSVKLEDGAIYIQV